MASVCYLDPTICVLVTTSGKDALMRVSRLTISHFRGIKSAELHFDNHALLVGPNNVGKSTICEALDLVLGPDRLNRFPPVEEYDFYNAEYLTPDDASEPPAIRIEVILTDLTPEVESACFAHVEFWSASERRTLDQGEAAAASPPSATSCLRLERRVRSRDLLLT
jgi:putative ATP-dependent endonuclease of the OLD family